MLWAGERTQFLLENFFFLSLYCRATGAPFSRNIIPSRKGLSGTNGLVYLASLLVIDKKVLWQSHLDVGVPLDRQLRVRNGLVQVGAQVVENLAKARFCSQIARVEFTKLFTYFLNYTIWFKIGYQYLFQWNILYSTCKWSLTSSVQWYYNTTSCFK